MTREEAQEIANNMSYNTAIYNVMQSKGIPYKKATKIKLNQLKYERLTKEDYEIAKKLFFKNNRRFLHFSQILFVGIVIDTMWECIERVREERNYKE